ncbi:MAG: phosphoribosylformylglycinamidine synthase subunit PurQ [Syntrophaceae bacterium]|nr:phosphoribosylformylglycinamidine synthase subunit PurQ [Syntrophaceae bacterium]
MEMAHACKMADADVVDIVHISELLCRERRLNDYTFLNLPGGFLDGDDLGSAKAGAHRFLCAQVQESRDLLFDQLIKFIHDGKLILGVCNGFQLMIKLGLLPAPGGNYIKQVATLTHNDSGRFEDRWVHLKANAQSPCIYTRGMDIIYLPVRHGEGKFIPQSNSVLSQMERKNLCALRYCEANGIPSMEYPANPNGSVNAVAGICDESGRLFGLMPHPEAYLDRFHHPRWTREKLPHEGQGLVIFRNAVNFIRSREF